MVKNNNIGFGDDTAHGAFGGGKNMTENLAKAEYTRSGEQFALMPLVRKSNTRAGIFQFQLPDNRRQKKFTPVMERMWIMNQIFYLFYG